MTYQPATPLADRFWAKVQKTDGCWLWTGATYNGYGQIGSGGARPRGKTLRAHRVAYRLMVGPIPKDRRVGQLDHLCRNRGCVNPAHLELVTQKENLRRGQGATGRNYRKTECVRGHPFDTANTYVTSRGFRQCRACREIRRAAYREAIAA